MTETLRNGVPLDVRNERYGFVGYPPLKTGDECVIETVSGKQVHVILLLGTGRKRWLVNAETLREYLRVDAQAKIAAVTGSEPQ